MDIAESQLNSELLNQQCSKFLHGINKILNNKDKNKVKKFHYLNLNANAKETLIVLKKGSLQMVI
jgi:hypothetical protein